jgi:hypothetical protein
MAAILLAGVVGGSGSLAGPTLAAPRIHYGLGAWLSIAADASHYVPGLTKLLRGLVGPSSIDYGTDGRLTVMVIGSDWRPNKGGERMDAVMVATINPTTHQMAAVSIPRDTGLLPLPNGDPWKGKVNSLYTHYRVGLGYSRVDAFDQMRLAIGHVLDVEVDYTVYARFAGFDFLVDQVGGVPTDVPLEIRDNRIWDPPASPKGALFEAGTAVPMQGASGIHCHGTPAPINWSKVPPCYRALLYVRSRHGKVGTANNSNYKRDKRQQRFLMSAVARVVAMAGDPTTDPTALQTLRDSAVGRMTENDFWTDLPITQDEDLLELFNLFNGAQDQPFLSATLKPTKYAYHVKQTRKYALKLPIVRALTAEWFAPVP